MPNVFVVNKSGHDFSAAEKYGSIVFLNEGPINRYAVNHMHRIFTERMESSEKVDYIVPCSLNVMNSIASSVFTFKHGTLNLLLFRDGLYIERNLVF